MKLTKTLLTSTLLATSIFSFQSTAWADTPKQQFQQAIESYNKRDYQKAFKLFHSLAEQGYTEAQYNLGVKRNLSEAKEWFRKACVNGRITKSCEIFYELSK